MFRNKKETFLTTKMLSFHKDKNRNSPKGLIHDFGKKKFQKIVFDFS